MKPVNEIIKEIENRGLTAYEISKNTLLSEDGINKILRGDSKNPRKTTLLVLQDYLWPDEPKQDIKEETPRSDARFEELIALNVMESLKPFMEGLNQRMESLSEQILRLDMKLYQIREMEQEIKNTVENINGKH